jgi:peptide deformylase
MAILRQVAQLGSPMLRKKANVVHDIPAQTIQSLIDDLIMTLHDVNGVGIAAPQVYESLKICIVASHPNPRYPHAPYMKPTPIINPDILSYSGKKAKDWEGCLSIPGVRALVPRFSTVTVKFTTRDGKQIEKIFDGFIARIIQHECDHLEGIVFLDRIETTKDIISEKEYLKLVMEKKRN